MKNYFQLSANKQDLIKNKFMFALVKHIQMKFGNSENFEEYFECDATFQ